MRGSASSLIVAEGEQTRQGMDEARQQEVAEAVGIERSSTQIYLKIELQIMCSALTKCLN